jgi:hypothetical protein
LAGFLYSRTQFRGTALGAGRKGTTYRKEDVYFLQDGVAVQKMEFLDISFSSKLITVPSTTGFYRVSYSILV